MGKVLSHQVMASTCLPPNTATAVREKQRRYSLLDFHINTWVDDDGVNVVSCYPQQGAALVCFATPPLEVVRNYVCFLHVGGSAAATAAATALSSSKLTQRSANSFLFHGDDAITVICVFLELRGLVSFSFLV